MELLSSYEGTIVKLEETREALELLRGYFSEKPQIGDVESCWDIVGFYPQYAALLALVLDKMDDIIAVGREKVKITYQRKREEQE